MKNEVVRKKLSVSFDLLFFLTLGIRVSFV